MVLFTRFMILVLAILIAGKVVPGISVLNIYTALVVAIALGTINLTIKPVLFVLTFPITILTFGFFSVVINAFLFWFVGTFVKGFGVDGFIPALLGSFLVSTISWLGNRFVT